MTMTGAAEFGMMCLRIIQPRLAPRARDAATKSDCLTWITADRATRAVDGQARIEIASDTLRMPRNWLPGGVGIELRMIMLPRSTGIPMKMSVIRDRMLSTQPP